MKVIETSLLPRDVRHLMEAMGWPNEDGKFDPETDSWSYPQTILRKLRAILRQLESAPPKP